MTSRLQSIKIDTRSRMVLWAAVAAFVTITLPGCGGGTDQPNPTPELAAERDGTNGASTSNQRQITVSPETTFIVSPLDEEGRVDFVRALNELTDPQVEPKENAAVALCQVLGSGQPDQRSHAVFLRRIGAEALPLGETGALSLPEPLADAFIERQSTAMSRPWTADEFPEVAEWIERIDSDLDACVLAVQRPKFYLPLVDTLPPEEPLPPLMSVLMPVVQGCREISRGLSARAMRRIAEGNTAGARRDILAMYRLARHLSHAPVSVQSLVSMAVEGQANRSTEQLLNSGRLDEDSAAEMLSKLRSLPASQKSVRVLETGERLTALDLVQAIKVRGPESLSFLVNVNDRWTTPDALNWDAALRIINDWYDQTTIAVSLPDYPARLAAIEKVEQRLRTRAKGEASEMAGVFSGGGFADSQAAGEQLGNLVAALTIPANTQVHIAETRSEMQTRIITVALELFRHHDSTGEFPQALSDLDTEIPPDLFTLEPLQYRRAAGSVIVYSLGPNRIDDGGPDRDGGTDDIGVVLMSESE